MDALLRLLSSGADATIADRAGDLALTAAVRANSVDSVRSAPRLAAAIGAFVACVCVCVCVMYLSTVSMLRTRANGVAVVRVCVCVCRAILEAPVASKSRMVLFANHGSETALFVAEQANIVLGKAAVAPSKTAADVARSSHSDAIVRLLLAALSNDGVPLASVRHAHECFARGLCFLERSK